MPRSERPAMSDYGVPTDPDGALAWAWALERLERCRNFWVVTASADGRPHAMPVWGVWLSEPDRFVFSCSPNSRKARNLRSNPQITIAIEDTVECVSVEGRAAEVSGAFPNAAIGAYARKYETDPEKQAAMIDFIGQNALYEVTPERAFGIIEREEEFSMRATRWVW